MLENILGITERRELARQEEIIGKRKAKALFESGEIDKLEIGTFKGLSDIHKVLFEDIYAFAGQMRQVNISKGTTMFAPVMFLETSLSYIDRLPHTTFDEIIEKYVDMNIAHPFREGNGRSMRIWLDLMLKHALGQVIDWNSIDKDDYLQAMQRSPIKDIEIKHFLKNALTHDLSLQTFMKGIDTSYYYEGYYEYRTQDL